MWKVKIHKKMMINLHKVEVKYLHNVNKNINTKNIKKTHIQLLLLKVNRQILRHKQKVNF